MRKWFMLAIGAWISGGGAYYGMQELIPLGVGAAFLGYFWFATGPELLRLARGERGADEGCLHYARFLGYTGDCSACYRGEGYQMEKWTALGAWAGMVVCILGACAVIGMHFFG